MVQTGNVRVDVAGPCLDHGLLHFPNVVPDPHHWRLEHCDWFWFRDGWFLHDHRLALTHGFRPEDVIH